MSSRIGSKALTAELAKLKSEIVATEADGTTITAEAMLAKMIWRQALGWVEDTRDEDGNLKKIVHLPVAWCQQYLFERLEGKAPVASPDTEGGIKAADRVRELARDRLNKLAVSTVGPPKLKNA